MTNNQNIGNVSRWLIIGALGLRLIICLCKGAVFGAVMPKIVGAVRKAALQN